MVVSFVILHYLAKQDTIECANSIIDNVKMGTNKLNIVIVDNGSPNNSYIELLNYFENHENVYVIKNDKNLGFAKGNNIGFNFAKLQLESDFISLINNDTIIEQSDFVEIAIKKYMDNKYYVLGPDIITADGYHQNPLNKQSWTQFELIKYRFKRRILLIMSLLMVDKILQIKEKTNKDIYRSDTLQGDVLNTALHGACFIFSPNFVKQFDGLYDKTFLYMEEDILKLMADHFSLLMMYSSELHIFHKEDIATNMIQGTDRSKKNRKNRYLIQSSLVYSRLKRKMDKNII